MSGEVALKLGRRFLGIELYEEYAQIAEERCRQAHCLRSDYEAENDEVTRSTEDFMDAPLSGARICDGEMANGVGC